MWPGFLVVRAGALGPALPRPRGEQSITEICVQGTVGRLELRKPDNRTKLLRALQATPGVQSRDHWKKL